MKMAEKIKEKLTASFSPDRLIVRNESYLHSGHAGDDGSGESHFAIEIEAGFFKDKNRVARERAVYQALSEEMKHIHALSIKFIN
jgi:BolA protein